MHLGHKGISRKFRPEFASDTEHDKVIIENIATTVGKRDTLWIGGDCFFDTEAYEAFFEKVFCHQVHWIIGNHDTDKAGRHLNVKRFCQMDNPMYGKVVSLVSYKGCWLSHHPIHPQELYGKLNIHGHTHKTKMQKEVQVLFCGSTRLEYREDERYVNVCCEHINYKPVDLNQLIKDH